MSERLIPKELSTTLLFQLYIQQIGKIEQLEQENHKLIGELIEGAKVQEALSPPEYFPIGENVAVAWRSVSAEKPGRPKGDGVGLFNTNTGLVVAEWDVVGKGVPAAMIEMAVRIYADHAAGYNLVDEAAIRYIEVAFQGLHDGHESTLPFTAVWIKIDPAKEEVLITRSAHEFPILVTPDGRCQKVTSQNDGVMINTGVYPVSNVDAGGMNLPIDFTKELLLPGSSLVVCSDGLREQRNSHGDLWGLTGLYKAAGEFAVDHQETGYCATELMEYIMHEAADFRGEMPQDDDCTVVVITQKRNDYGLNRTDL
jgi:serine phosphatase RsbU (regulator of sigma subunit)